MVSEREFSGRKGNFSGAIQRRRELETSHKYISSYRYRWYNFYFYFHLSLLQSETKGQKKSSGLEILELEPIISFSHNWV